MDGLNLNMDYDSFLSDDCLSDFLKIVRRYKTANQEENDEMLLEYYGGNKEIKDFIVKRNINLVVSMVFQLGTVLRAEEKLDYIQSGLIGLINALEKMQKKRYKSTHQLMS